MAPRIVMVLALVVAVLAAITPVTRADVQQTYYYYLITASDGSQSVRMMGNRDARDQEKEFRKEYAEARKQYAEELKEWYKAVGNTPYPVPKPVKAKIKKLGRVPSTERSRERAEEKYDRRLEVYDVCIVVDTDGEKSAEALRRDKKRARLVELLRAYADAFKQWRQQFETEEEAKKNTQSAPIKPRILVFKGGLRDADLADRFAEKLNEKLEKMKEREEAKKEKRGED